MMDIGKPVKKTDHDSKADGSANYTADLLGKGMLYAKVIRSTKAKAIIKEIKMQKLPSGVRFIDWRDIPGENVVHVVEDDMPVFAVKNTEYVGEPVALLVGPDKDQLRRLCENIEIEYEEIEPILCMEDSEEIFYEEGFSYGDVDGAFADADSIYEERFFTGYQEHAYLETQGIIAEPRGDRMIIRGSMQCPYYIYYAVAKVLGVSEEHVRVIQEVTGGGFGGKEDYPSVLACEAAVAAACMGKPVCLIFDRREDMAVTSKRHPADMRYRAAVKDGKVTAWDIELDLNAGAYKTLSLVVLQRSIICCSGVYSTDNIRVRGRAKKTNTVPCGAFRGFGDPQVFFAVETFMDHLAEKLGTSAWDFKRRNLARKGQFNSTRGRYHFDIPLLQMMEALEQMCGYHEKREKYKKQTGRYRKGIGMSLHFHGTGFATTKDEADGVSIKVLKDCEGNVSVLTANTDMGQGLFTTFAKIAGKALSIPYDKVKVIMPDTDLVPNSGPTVASRSIITVGELVRKASERLKREWKEGEEQIIEEKFTKPSYCIDYDGARYFGDPYPDYAWGVIAVEVEVDTFTGRSNVTGVWGLYDIGTIIDGTIACGQMEGGILQGLGYASMEQLSPDARGVIRNNSYSDYIIPTSEDVKNICVSFWENDSKAGPFGAKGAGELPNGGAAPAYIAAMEQAMGGVQVHHIPFSAEEVLKIFEEEKQSYGGN